ncbi:uncharacterized protein LOC125041601 isoform X2 [Penaeus chinensis]|uniref:uncharacterized protein LOC125041601 isoform X2 n=1 Tax=Penaeus chinensis TaxID=139456 RepID=UPI001FB7D07E|nr:uncharacterized protein LOC125041601 isoform X2 [Penaeus chinensis]
MSGAGTGEREGRSSRRPSPLRATVPLQAMHRTSPLRLRNRISPDTEITPSLDLSTATTTKVARVRAVGRVRAEQGRVGGNTKGRSGKENVWLRGPA